MNRHFLWIGCVAALGLHGCAPTSAPTPGTSALVFTALEFPGGPGAAQVTLSLDVAGNPVASWLEPRGDEGDVALVYARLNGTVWSAPVEVARGSDWIVSAADMPSVRLLSDQLFVADWRIPSEASPYAYDIAVSVSANGGQSWSDPLRLNDDGTATEHGFVSWLPVASGAMAIWLDGRGLEDEGTDPPSGSPAGTSLRSATLNRDGEIVEQGVIDDLVCDCCRTDVAQTREGAAVIYRDRTPTEIRDIQVRVRRANNWSGSVTLGPDDWRIEGCPINGPAIDARESAVAAAWFTAAGGRGRVRFARSDDGGQSFGAAVDLDSGDAIGQVGVVLDAAGAAHVSWWRRGEAGAELVVRSVGSSGDLSAPETVAKTPVSRPENVPQLVLSHGRLIVSWADESEIERQVSFASAQRVGE